MKHRLQGLDGVRGIAVSLVVFGHAGNFPEFRTASELWPIDLATLGVTVFFVLSGFLITTLLIDERARNGRVSLREFSVRRAIRIFPAAYLYIAFIAVAAAAGWVSLAPGDLWHAVTYTMNYNHDRAWALGHLWSLTVEEQFYLLWPLLFILSGVRAIFVAASIIVLAPLLRVIAWVFFPGERVGIDEEFQYVSDSLATGCLMALLVERFGLEKLVARVPRWLFAAAAPATLVGAAFTMHPSFYLPIGATMVNAGIALCLLWLVARPDARPARLLNSRIAIFIGTISYSLYLWQQFFLDSGRMAMHHAVPLAVLLSLLAAVASYHLVEKPLLGLRAKFRH